MPKKTKTKKYSAKKKYGYKKKSKCLLFLGERTTRRDFVVQDKIQLGFALNATTGFYTFTNVVNSYAEMAINLGANQDFISQSNVYEFFRWEGVTVQCRYDLNPGYLTNAQTLNGTYIQTLPPISFTIDFKVLNLGTPVNNWKYLGSQLRMQMIETQTNGVSKTWYFPLVYDLSTASNATAGIIGPIWMNGQEFTTLTSGNYGPFIYCNLGMSDLATCAPATTALLVIPIATVTFIHHTRWAKRI